eukprot:3737274-Amphidinium_carterae.4
MAGDRFDLGYSVKELMRSAASSASSPTQVSKAKLKRVWRYVKDVNKDIIIDVDSDHAGCRKTRKSTTGLLARRLGHIIHELNATQPVTVNYQLCHCIDTQFLFAQTVIQDKTVLVECCRGTENPADMSVVLYFSICWQLLPVRVLMLAVHADSRSSQHGRNRTFGPGGDFMRSQHFADSGSDTSHCHVLARAGDCPT